MLFICQQEQEKVWNSGTAPQGRDRRIAEDEWANAKRSREEGMLPLVLPVSVPVRRADQEPAKPPSGWTQRPLHEPVQCERKPSVIVTRRRSLRSSLPESTGQVRCPRLRQLISHLAWTSTLLLATFL